MTPRQEWPRVTAILKAVGLGPDPWAPVGGLALEYARRRGVAVHAAIEADHYGYPVDLGPDALPYLEAYKRFLAESGHEPIASEIEVVHPTWQYRGHPDRIGWLRGHRVILDWKTGESVDLRASGRQLAAYRLAWNAEYPKEPVDGIAVVQLRADGTYGYHEVSAAEHEPVFLAAVLVYRAQQEGRRR